MRPLLLVVPALLLWSASALEAQGKKKPQPLAGQCGVEPNPPCPGAAIISHTFNAAPNPPEAGPYTYTITVQNVGNVSGTISVECITLSGQLPCITPSPSSFSLASGATRVVTVGYTTKGLGRFNQEYRADWVGPGERSGDTLAIGVMTVAGAGIAAHLNPLDSADFPFGDSLRAVFDHASGVNTGSIKLLIDGVDSTSRATINGTTLTAVNLHLTEGFRSFGTYVCAGNGRCDTLRTTLRAGLAPIYSLDDSLPMTEGLGMIAGMLPGALPLPLPSQRGCPVNVDDPEIRLGEPTSFISQPANATTPAGLIFRAMIVWDTMVVVNTLNHDFRASDNKTCANYVYLQDNQYDWAFWQDTDPNDPLWDVYPYGDRSVGGGGGQSIGATPEVSSSSAGGAGVSSAQRGKPAPPDSGVVQFLGSAGAINPSTFKLWLNGALIADNNTPIGTQVRRISFSKVGATYQVSATHPSLHKYNPLNPPSDNGGWNEMIASIADSTGHRSYVRSRFVQLGGAGPGNPIAPIPVTPVRNFSHLDQGECAAFGALQCGGVMLTQGIPGFVTRDRDRSLHLVYRSTSQRAPTILPYEVVVERTQLAPESLQVTLREGGALVGANGQLTHYFGTVTPPNPGPFDVTQVLDEHATARRVVGTDLPAATASAAIRTITTSVRSFYSNGSQSREDTVRQEVVQLYLSDTTTSRFSAGWALAEQSRLVLGLMSQGAPAAIWLSGDGSYTIFRKPGSVWVPPPGETSQLVATGYAHPDSAAYVAYLWNGASVGFRSDGWQRYTADLLGNRTRFVYSSVSPTRLDSIVDPAGHAFSFRYDSASAVGLVSDIWLRAPSGVTSRVATLRFDANRRLAVAKIWISATKADSTVFGYHATAPGAFVTSVTDPRSTPAKPIVTTFTYDPLYYTPETIVRPPDHVSVLTAYYRDPLRRMLPRVVYGRAGQRVERMLAADQARGTFIGFSARPVDFTVDPFGGPTYVRHFAPPGYMTPDFFVEDYGGDDVRVITRDSVGRVTRIVHGNPVYYDQSSVIYEYDTPGRIARIIRNTAQYPITSSTLDTVRFAYDSIPAGTYRCSRLLSMTDPMGGVDTTVYGASNESRCLPLKMIGLAQDTTIFTYGTLLKGNPAGVRPISVRDPNGLVQSMNYDPATWNSSVSTRAADGAASRAFYGAFGRPDSLLDPLNVRTFFRYDQSGRVIRTKTGTGTTAPTTWTFYGPGGLVDSVRVYGSNDGFEAGQDSLAVTPIQTTKTFYNRLGWVDSTKTPGGRRVKYHHDRRFGQPIIENTGIGSYLSRAWDWQGRLTAEYQSQVGPSYSSNGDDFAEHPADSIYSSYNVSWPNTLSSGQVHKFDYDNRGRRTQSWTRDYGLGGEWLVDRTFSYSTTGALVADVLRFADGATVTRTYRYNRRGQRTMAATAVTSVTVSEPKDTMRYVYNNATARLDSLSDTAYTTSGSPINIGRVKWMYDRGGRDTLQSVRLGGATAGELQTRSGYDAAGRPNLLETKTVGGNTWYTFGSVNYNLGDQLLGYSAAERKPSAFETWNYTASYATNGTGRLVASSKALSGSGFNGSFSYGYDVLGNRLTDQSQYTYSAGDGCQAPFTSTFGSDNQLKTRLAGAGCSRREMYWNDRAGNRLVQLDTTNGAYSGPKASMTYTAKHQLFFSMTRAGLVGSNNDYNWHWYDATGLRAITQVGGGTGWVPTVSPATATGPRSYYVYEGNDVAMVLVRSGGSWWVRQRYLTGGLDNQVAGRFTYLNSGTVTRNLALVNTRDGTTLTAVRADGSQEAESWYLSRDPFGKVDQTVGTVGNLATETGLTGASTPNQTGGFVYLRNRWYDPQTGRFLTQDPIGLAGGVNLYSYAGNNPVMFTDPFGLCKWHDIACLDDLVWAKIGGKGYGGAIAAQFVTNMFTLFGASSVDAHAKDAARGDRLAAGLLVGEILINAAPLASEAKTGTIVIGENMARVGKYAAEIGAETFKPAAQGFINIMRENAAWLRGKIEEGYKIIDIGIDAARTNRSPFYAAERKIVERTGAEVTTVSVP